MTQNDQLGVQLSLKTLLSAHLEPFVLHCAITLLRAPLPVSEWSEACSRDVQFCSDLGKSRDYKDYSLPRGSDEKRSFIDNQPTGRPPGRNAVKSNHQPDWLYAYCTVPEHEHYCSDCCKDASGEEEIEIQCDCKHESCALNFELAQGSMPT